MPNFGALAVHAVTPDRWADLAELFERPDPRGGNAVEAYAADRLGGTSSTDFMGVTDWFLAEGFRPVRRARSKTVVRLDLP